MHKYERIALWTLVILTLLIVVFRPAVSGWTGSPSSIFDVSEFNFLPSPVSSAVKNNGGAILSAMGSKFTQEWKMMTPEQQNMILSQMQNATKEYINMINTKGVVNHPVVQAAVASQQMMPAPAPPMPMPMPAPAPPMPMPMSSMKDQAVFASPQMIDQAEIGRASCRERV